MATTKLTDKPVKITFTEEELYIIDMCLDVCKRETVNGEACVHDALCTAKRIAVAQSVRDKIPAKMKYR